MGVVGPLQLHEHVAPDGPVLVDEEILEYRPRLQAVPSQHTPAGDAQLQRPEYQRGDIGRGRPGPGRPVRVQRCPRQDGRRFVPAEGGSRPVSGALPAEQLPEPAFQAVAPAGGGGPTRPGLIRLPRLSLPAHQECVNPFTDFPLDQAAGPGGGLKLIGDPQVLGAPAPERAHRLDRRAGATGGIAGVGKCAFHRPEERILGQPLQLGDRLGQTGPGPPRLALGHGGPVLGTPFAAVSCHGGPPKHPASRPEPAGTIVGSRQSDISIQDVAHPMSSRFPSLGTDIKLAAEPASILGFALTADIAVHGGPCRYSPRSPRPGSGRQKACIEVSPRSVQGM